MSRDPIEALLEYLNVIVKNYGDCDEDWYDTKMMNWGHHSLTLGELFQCIQRLEVMDADRQEKRLYKADAEYWQREWEKKHLNNVPDAMLEAEVSFWKEKWAEEKKRRVDASRWACAWKRAAKHNRSQLRTARTVQEARKSGRECSRVLLDEMVTILEERNEARRWARRLYRAAKQAREAILDLGRRTCDAYEYKTTNWRKYLGANMLDAYDTLCKTLGEEE